MIFQYDKYKINHFRNNELIISIDKSYILLEIGLVFISNILLYYYLWDKLNFNQIDIWKISVGFITITSLYNLFKNITLLFDGQVYVFNNTINRISKNGYTVDQLDNICQIRIIEYYDSDSSNQFELQIQLLNNSPIIFEKTPNLKFQKTLGKATGSPHSARLSGAVLVLTKVVYCCWFVSDNTNKGQELHYTTLHEFYSRLASIDCESDILTRYSVLIMI